MEEMKERKEGREGGGRENKKGNIRGQGER